MYKWRRRLYSICLSSASCFFFLVGIKQKERLHLVSFKHSYRIRMKNNSEISWSSIISEFWVQTHNFWMRNRNEKTTSKWPPGIATSMLWAKVVCCFFRRFYSIRAFILISHSVILINLLFRRSACEERTLIYLRVHIAIHHNHISVALYFWIVCGVRIPVFVTLQSRNEHFYVFVLNFSVEHWNWIN